MGLLEGLCGCLKLTVKKKKRKIESKSTELSGEKKRHKLDSESTEKKEDTVDGGENDSEIAEGIPFEEDYYDSMDGKVINVILKSQYVKTYRNTRLS